MSAPQPNREVVLGQVLRPQRGTRVSVSLDSGHPPNHGVGESLGAELAA